MVEVKNLTKIYGNGDVKQTKALNNVSFKLPDSGLIFVVGKSGSGKSTLLNMLGALDDHTSGEIIIDNVDITKMSNRQLDLYRSQFIGIIYQNYNLFENDTVLDNIKISLEINSKDTNDEQIYNLLDKLDLSENKDKIVKNMSGGQKQRVAIARALIKDPRVILADEPTGNLDSKTTDIIFSLLKEISKEKLVIVISHDTKSSLKYADRILEISDGEIYSDLSRNIDNSIKEEGITYFYSEKPLSASELDNLNKKLKDSKYRVRNNNKEFSKTEVEIKNSTNKLELKNVRNKGKTSFKNALLFLRNCRSSFIGTVFLAIFIISVLALSVSFASFDGKTALNDIATTYNKVNLVIEKGYSINDNPNNVEKTLIYPVAQEDKEALESVYDGKYYSLYSVPLMCYEYSLEFGIQVNFTNESSIYVPSGLGVSVVDNDFLSDRFNNIELAAGSLYKIEESNKLIITDYLADSFIYFNSALKSEDPNDPYQVILSNLVGEGTQRYQIGAIINTHYKERYNVIFESLDYISSHPDRATEIATEVYSSKIYSIFKDEIFSSLAIGYTLNPNYIEEYKHNVLHGFFRTGYMYYDNDFNNPIYKIERIAIFVDPTILEDDQIRISPSILPKIQTSISALSNDEINIDDGIDVTIANYQYNQKQGDDPVMQENVTIISAYDTGYQYDAIYVSRGLMDKIIEDQVVEYGFILDEKDDAVAINKILKSKMYYSDSTLFTTLFSLVNITEIFTSIFTIVAVFLIVILAVIVISHNTRIIKHERYRIGIYKALGCSDISLSQSLVIASLITVVAILSLSIPFSYITAYLSNELMKFSFSKFLSSSIYSQITIISFDLVPVLIFNGIVFTITLFSSFIPFMLIKNIKPNQILRKVDD